MKKKNKQIVTIIFVILAFIFLFVVKVLNLNPYEIFLGLSFIGFLKVALENFPNGEALLMKLSIIT